MDHSILSPVKTKKQIAAEYKISPRTLRRWFIKNGMELPNGYLTPNEQKKVYEKFGVPPQLSDNNNGR